MTDPRIKSVARKMAKVMSREMLEDIAAQYQTKVLESDPDYLQRMEVLLQSVEDSDEYEE
jgi:vancomycin permeability regulator SanA